MTTIPAPGTASPVPFSVTRPLTDPVTTLCAPTDDAPSASAAKSTAAKTSARMALARVTTVASVGIHGPRRDRRAPAASHRRVVDRDPDEDRSDRRQRPPPARLVEQRVPH